MQINIGNYRIRRYDKLNLCIEIKKEKQKAKNPYGRNGKRVQRQLYKIIYQIKLNINII